MNLRITRTDLIVYGLILGFVGLQFAFCLRIPDFQDSDITYVELARSIRQGTQYGFDYRPETRFPPGFPIILACFSLITGFAFVPLVRAMSIFTALGFMVCYKYLQVQESRLCAVLICLLLLSSPQVFAFATQNVLPELPYLFSSFLVLLTVREFQQADEKKSRTALWIGCAFALAASIMIRTAGITLLTGLGLWLAASFIRRRRSGFVRLKPFLLLFLFGASVQALWTWRAKVMGVMDWPLNGYPGSYIAEAFLKRGDYPELGYASAGDVVSRLAGNLIGYAAGFTEMISHKAYVVPFWSSTVVALPVLLVTLGVLTKIWNKKEGLAEWYFMSYMVMFLLWPWDYQVRFLLPVAPLACLYFWHGVKQLSRMATKNRKVLGLTGLPFSVILGMSATGFAKTLGGIQPFLSALLWLAASLAGTYLLFMKERPLDRASSLPSFIRLMASTASLSFRRWAALGFALPLVVAGFVVQLQEGHANLKGMYRNLADVTAAEYVKNHTSINAVIMARRLDIAYHYSGRKVVWFPPISDPRLLMDGILRYKVDFILLVERKRQPWFPDEQKCLLGLLARCPEAFCCVYQDSQFSLFKVLRQPHVSCVSSLFEADRALLDLEFPQRITRTVKRA